MVIDSAHDDCFDAYYAKPSGSSKNRPKVEEESLLKPYFDGSASWFTSVLKPFHISSRDLVLMGPRTDNRMGMRRLP